ncbi:MAG: DUF2520 domain-containing protein [Bryobacterales bacterium]|nr:DUF2520 domain-containing protein [Bryobacterales bacterium]
MTESPLARVPSLARALGPIVAVNKRLASRYANLLRAGWASEPTGLLACRLIVVQAKAEEWGVLSARMGGAGCPVAILAEEYGAALQKRIRALGVAVCTVVISPAAARPLMVLDGDAAAVRAVRIWASGGGVRCVELRPGGSVHYGAGIVLVSALVTPLVDAATRSLRASGLSHVDSRQIVSRVLEGALRSYDAHGRKGWPNPTAAGRVEAISAQCETLAARDAKLERLYARVLGACLEYYGQDTEWLDESEWATGASNRKTK